MKKFKKSFIALLMVVLLLLLQISQTVSYVSADENTEQTAIAIDSDGTTVV